MENANSNITDELENILFDFVKRASSKGATPEEVQALPAIANILCRMLHPSWF